MNSLFSMNSLWRSALSLFVCIGVIYSFFLVTSASAQPSSPAKGEQISGADEELGKDSSTEINVRNADIAAIIRIFSKKTKRNYILDDRVKGKVSIYLPGKVSSQDSIRILDSVLLYKGFSAVPIGENLWKVIPAKEARQSTIPTLTDEDGGGSSASIVTRLVNLKFVAADDAKQVLSQLISPDGFINSYAATNSLIIIDTEDNIERLLGILQTIDISASDRDMTIIQIENADAADIAAKLNELLGSGDKADKAGASDLLFRNPTFLQTRANIAPPPGSAGLAPGTAAAPEGMVGNGVTSSPSAARQPKIIADERTNSIIVVADEDTTARIRALINQLDSKVDLSGLRFYVYRCQHAKADELADVLAGLVGEGSGSGSKDGSGRNSGSSAIADGDGDLISRGGGRNSTNRNSQNRGNQFGRTQDRLSGQQRTPGRSRNENSSGSNAVRSVQLGENFSISADPATNTLIIFGSKPQYEKVKSLLLTLDVKRRQVLVEAMLMEVALTETERLKTSFITSGGGKDGGVIAQGFGSDIISLLSNPSGVQDFSVAAASAGTLTIGGGSSQISIPTQSVLLNAIQTNTNVNVLSAPTILATNNEQAEIVVGQNVPFLASTSADSTNLSNTFNQIDRQDVGITLRLTPQISSRDSVTLNIFTEVSSLVATDSSLGPTTSIRTSETSVISKDGQMIVIGGLMSDDNNTTDSGVPFLKDVPVLGHIFRFSNTERRRTNLLILITPRVIKDQYDHRDLTIANKDVIEREIESRELVPNRREILHDKAIDRVAESEPFEGTAPSTILAPEDHNEDAVTANNIPLPPPASTGLGSKDEILEFSIDPKLKSVPKPSFESKTSARGSLNLPKSDSFYVIELKSGSEADKSFPFSLSSKRHLAALRAPAEASASVSKLFQTGSEIGYMIDGKSSIFRVAGIFASEKEAKSQFQELGDQWYELSPYEIMKLGSGPWVGVN